MTTLNLNLHRVDVFLPTWTLCEYPIYYIQGPSGHDQEEADTGRKRMTSCMFLHSDILLRTQLYLRNDYSQKLPHFYLLIGPQTVKMVLPNFNCHFWGLLLSICYKNHSRGSYFSVEITFEINHYYDTKSCQGISWQIPVVPETLGTLTGCCFNYSIDGGSSGHIPWEED